jgi:hypothetical protein
MSALRSLTGVKRTRYAHCEFFAFRPKAVIGWIKIPRCSDLRPATRRALHRVKCSGWAPYLFSHGINPIRLACLAHLVARPQLTAAAHSPVSIGEKTECRLQGKIAVITGGSSGYRIGNGSAVCRGGRLCLYITGRRQSELDKAVTEIGRDVAAVQGGQLRRPPCKHFKLTTLPRIAI